MKRADVGLHMQPPLRPDDPGQDALRDWFGRLGEDVWLPLLTSMRSDANHAGTFCALIPAEGIEDALREPGWDLLRSTHGPGFSGSPDGEGGWNATYHRIGTEPVEALVIDRNFHGVRPGYPELSEEFRLYHNLYGELNSSELYRIDDAGTAELAAVVEPDRVMVRTGLVRQYQAARQMALLLFIDTVVFVEDPALLPADEQWVDAGRHLARYGGDSGGRPFTHLIGKRVIPPPPVDSSGIWPYEPEDNHFPEFIIGTDDLGHPIRYACDPDKLANYFGANPGAPHYLTPVHFRRDVLVKYYDRPDMYTVEDGYLRCSGLWGLSMDNDAADVVIVFLGDLGRDLPRGERDYWLSYNIPPFGAISETAFRRGFLGQFADAQSSDLRLRVALGALQKEWPRRFGWSLLLDPEPADAHLFDQIRTPLHDTETEFEELVRTLAKILVDSLNEHELVRTLPAGPDGEKGLAKLQRWFASVAYDSAEADIRFLRNLQAVRSEVVAHRKGSGYQKALDRAVGTKRRAAAAHELLDQALRFVGNLLGFAGAPD